MKKIFYVIPLFIFICMEYLLNTKIYHFNNFFNSGFEKIPGIIVLFINISIYYLILFVFILIINNYKKSFIIYNLLFFIFSIANYFVQQARGYGIVAGDFLCIKTAFNVRAGYTFSLSHSLFIMIILYIVIFFMTFKYIPNKKIFKNYKKNLLTLILILSSFIMFLNKFFTIENLSHLEIYNAYSPQIGINTRGWMYSFFASTNGYIELKPKGYNKENVEKELNKYKVDNNDFKKPNIIMIMNEAFSDLDEFGLETNMKYMSSLKENTIQGDLFVSIFGGYTANTEFEALTGHSMINYDGFCIPYLQKIKSNKNSFASLLKENDYNTIGFHDYIASGYNRSIVYPFLGFDETIFCDDKDIGEIEIERSDFPSDSWDYQRIIQEFENKKDANPTFLFNVTVQNHTPYNNKLGENIQLNLPQTFNENKIPSNFSSKEKYLDSLKEYILFVNKSDLAFKELIDYFTTYEEDTIIVFFGDHQSDILEPFYDSKENNINVGKVPFLIWTNFDSKEAEDIQLSSNFITPFLIQEFQLPTNNYFNFLNELRKDIPVLSTYGLKTINNETLYSFNDLDENIFNKLQYYKWFQYYYMSN